MLVVEVLISALLVLAGVFGLIGSYGLVKLQDRMARLHAPTKATTLGVGGSLIASMLYFDFIYGEFSFHELIVALFLFLTAPITTHFISKLHIHRQETPASLPETQSPRGWATFDDAADNDPTPGEGDERRAQERSSTAV